MRFAKILGPMLMPLALTLATALDYQAPQPALADFFERLVQTNGSPLPTTDELLHVTDQVPGMAADAVAAALPVLSSALRSPNESVKLYAASALFAISRRPDSGKLLGPHMNSIAALLDERDARLQATPSVILLNLKPQPLPEAIPPLVIYLKRTDTGAKAQPSAVFALARLAPENPEVVVAVAGFLSRPLDSRTRIDTMNALGDPRVKDARIIGLIINSLDDPDRGVRFSAVQSLTRMGSHAVFLGQSALRKVAENSNEAAEVRATAKQALESINTPR